ncbi:hypothetical protein BLNAU_9632 [Blattamonas nauphoetae]|uniref:Uncharacterized protein n=1 Tax=Blattamonas nauphoetae TaxID=2049346 RepID=A0ABQ9XV99_9EUKA|nr:hypothetical protein BLNAU_9632 [Blattamonas nauphoetae]
MAKRKSRAKNPKLASCFHEIFGCLPLARRLSTVLIGCLIMACGFVFMRQTNLHYEIYVLESPSRPVASICSVFLIANGGCFVASALIPCPYSWPVVYFVASFNLVSPFMLSLFLLEVYTRKWNIDFLITHFVRHYQSKWHKESGSAIQTLCRLYHSPDLDEPFSQTLQFSAGFLIASEVLNVIAGVIWLHHTWLSIFVLAVPAFNGATAVSLSIRTHFIGKKFADNQIRWKVEKYLPPDGFATVFAVVDLILAIILPCMGRLFYFTYKEKETCCVEKISDCRRTDSKIVGHPYQHAGFGALGFFLTLVGFLANVGFYYSTLFGHEKFEWLDTGLLVSSYIANYREFLDDCGIEMDEIHARSQLDTVLNRERYAIWTVRSKSARMYLEGHLLLLVAWIAIPLLLVLAKYLIHKCKYYMKYHVNVTRSTPKVEDDPSEDESELSLLSAELRELYRKVQKLQKQEMSETVVLELRELLTRAVPLDARFFQLTEEEVTISQRDDPLSALSTLDGWTEVVGLGLGRELFTVSSESSPDVQFRHLVQSIPVELERIVSLFEFGEFSKERRRGEQDWLVWRMACWRVEILVSHFDDTIPLGRRAEKTQIHAQSDQMTAQVSEIECRADSRNYLSWRESMPRTPSMVQPLPPLPTPPSSLKVHPESPRSPPACPVRPHPTRIVVVNPAPEVDTTFVSFRAEMDIVNIGMPAEPVHSYSLRRGGGREVGRSKGVSWETVEMERTHIALHQNLSSTWRRLNQQRRSAPHQPHTITASEADELIVMGRQFHQHTAELADTHARTDPSTALLVLDKFDEVDVLMSESRGFTFRVPPSLTAEDQFSVLVRVQGKERRRIVEGLAHSNNVSDLEVLGMDGMRWEMAQRRAVVLFHLLKEKHKHSTSRVAEIEKMFTELMSEVWAIEHSADVAGWENWEERTRWLAR